MRNLVYKLSLVLMISSPVFASGPGTTVGQALDLGLGARPMGMGGAFFAVSDDLNSQNYNPAGISNVKSYAVDTHYNSLYEDLSYQGISVGVPGPMRTALGFGYYSLSSGNIPRTTATNHGLFLEDAGSFNTKDSFWIASLGTKFYRQWEFGFSVKGFRESLGEASASTTLYDAGLAATFFSRLHLAAGILNNGGSLQFIDEKEDISKTIVGGASYRFLEGRNLLVDVDVKKHDTNGTTSVVGAEYVVTRVETKEVTSRSPFKKRGSQPEYFREVTPIIAFRVGMDSDIKDSLGGAAGLSGGLGFFFKRIRLDYAFVNYGDLGLSHQVSMGYSFGSNPWMSLTEGNPTYEPKPSDGWSKPLEEKKRRTLK